MYKADIKWHFIFLFITVLNSMTSLFLFLYYAYEKWLTTHTNNFVSTKSSYLTSNLTRDPGFSSSLELTQIEGDSLFSPHRTMHTFSLVPESFCVPVWTYTVHFPLLRTGISKPFGIDSRFSIRFVDGWISGWKENLHELLPLAF